MKMKKMSKLVLAAMLLSTSAVAFGCSSGDKPANSSAQQDTEKTYQKAFVTTMLAEDRVTEIFEPTKVTVDGKEVSYLIPKKSADEAVQFLSTSGWDKDLAKKEFEAVLGDKALLDKVNKDLEAAAKAKNKEFKPVAAVADDKKLGANAMTGATKAQYQDVKVSEKDGKYTIEYKGLKYTLEKNGDSFKIIAKEGKLQK
jgi:hypothetical protein